MLTHFTQKRWSGVVNKIFFAIFASVVLVTEQSFWLFNFDFVSFHTRILMGQPGSCLSSSTGTTMPSSALEQSDGSRTQWSYTWCKMIVLLLLRKLSVYNARGLSIHAGQVSYRKKIGICRACFHDLYSMWLVYNVPSAPYSEVYIRQDEQWPHTSLQGGLLKDHECYQRWLFFHPSSLFWSYSLKSVR